MARKAVRKSSRKSQTASKRKSADAPFQQVATAAGEKRILSARPDGLDFRDKMYVPNLIEVPIHRDLEDYLAVGTPVLDQGNEGACTGFGLATVANYLLRKRKIVPDAVPVSPYMFYDMARRYDEWPGEDYEGSSCRGAIKGWFKHGACKNDLWKTAAKSRKALTEKVIDDATSRPLGAYFRVNHKDLVAMHSAIAETEILYASAMVHGGWEKIRKNGKIKLETTQLGGHAFAIVAYDRDGFWIQNSWGDDWGRNGFCHVSYEDWLVNGTDVWVARLGAPVALPKVKRSGVKTAVSGIRTDAYLYSDLRPHVINIKNDGQLDEKGDIGTTAATVREILQEDFPRITAGWKKKRLVLYAHGGLVGMEDALRRISDYRQAALEAECYPLAFIWKSDYWSTLKNMLADATRRRRPEGALDSSKDFMLDRLDDALEPLARMLTGKTSWDEMKENALLSTVSSNGGARIVANEIAKLVKTVDNVEIHIIGHSAGSIFHAPLVQYLTGKTTFKTGPLAKSGAKGLGLKVNTCTLWAPACTTALFKESYLPAVQAGSLEKFAVFALTNKAEQDDHCARIYNKSLLYLVSNAFEERTRIPIFRPDGEAILGMQKFIESDADLKKLFGSKKADLVLSPNTHKPGTSDAAQSTSHGGFDDDQATIKATLARITGKGAGSAELAFNRGASSRRGVRRNIDEAVDRS